MANGREAEHVRRLVHSVEPGIGDSELARLMGKADGNRKPYRPFDDAAKSRRTPAAHFIEELAGALGVNVLEVVEATLLDAQLPVEPGYDREQHRAALLIGRIPAGRRGAFVDVLERLVGVMRSWTEPSGRG